MKELQVRLDLNKHKIPLNVYQVISEMNSDDISNNRKALLIPLVDFIQIKSNNNEEVKLNFICTHNSRRSQLAQVWAQTVAVLFGVEVVCFSGGVETTAFNESAVEALESVGFRFDKTGNENPVYSVSLDQSNILLKCFSKLYDEAPNPSSDFAAIMVCSDADDNCPFIPGCNKRISLPYEDPKLFDGTDRETEMYQQRSLEIAREMKYVFSQLISA